MVQIGAAKGSKRVFLATSNKKGIAELRNPSMHITFAAAEMVAGGANPRHGDFQFCS